MELSQKFAPGRMTGIADAVASSCLAINLVEGDEV
jgi:hypothetical protein